MHLIWNAPFVHHRELLGQCQVYAGDQCSFYITSISDSQKAVKYALQYAVRQSAEKVWFTMSRRWLPDGYHEHWRALNAEWWGRVPEGMRFSDNEVIMRISQNDEGWRRALIRDMDIWVDEQRNMTYQKEIG